MRKIKSGALAALLAGTTALTANAAGLDRSGLDITLLFEEGDVAQLSFGRVSPHLSANPVAGVAPNGISDAGVDYNVASFGYKHQFTDKFSMGVMYDKPYGAHIRYTNGPFSAQGPLPIDGQADVDSDAVTVLGRYEFGNGFSVHGGARFQRIKGYVVSSPGVLDVSSDWDVGGVIGVAYEKPEIALRVALTYSSKISHDATGTEDVLFGSFGGLPLTATTMRITSPESINLNFQSGVAKDTLVFGSIRWVHWDGFDVTSPNSGGEYVAYHSNDYTLTLGVGRKITDKLSLAATVGYEHHKGETVSTLGPTDGYWSMGLGGSYTIGNTKITVGVRHVWLGNAVTTTGGVPFQDNTATGFGISIHQRF